MSNVTFTPDPPILEDIPRGTITLTVSPKLALLLVSLSAHLGIPLDRTAGPAREELGRLRAEIMYALGLPGDDEDLIGEATWDVAERLLGITWEDSSAMHAK